MDLYRLGEDVYGFGSVEWCRVKQSKVMAKWRAVGSSSAVVWRSMVSSCIGDVLLC